MRALGGAKKAVLFIFTGAGLSQVILLLTSVAIARIYDPGQIGIYSILIAVSVVAVPVATLGLGNAVAPAERAEDAMVLVHTAICSLVVFAGALTALAALTLSATGGAGLFGLGSASLFVGPITLAAGLFGVLLQLGIRLRSYRSVAVRGVVQASVLGGVQVALGLALQAASSLAIGDVLGRLAGSAMLAPSYWRLRAGASFPLPSVRSTIRKHRDVVSHYMPSLLIETAAIQAGVILVGIWFGADAAGFLGFAQRMIFAPITLIGAAIGAVVLGEVAKRRRDGELDRGAQFSSLVIRLAPVAGAFALVVIVVGPAAFVFLFGQEWETSGSLARAIAIPAAVGLVWNPLSQFFVALEFWKPFLVLSAARLLISVALGWCAYELGAGLVGTVAAIASGGALVEVLSMNYLRLRL